jgi:outer membrane protein OmpU
MKKILLSTALLSATAGMAAAEVSFSGYGRFGLEYVENRAQETQVSMRLRFNINAKTETDSGVTFGGRIRLQYTDGQTAAGLSPAYVYASYEGFRVEVGNANAAYDSAALMYNSEMGFLDSSFGDPQGSYYGFSTGAYGAAEANRMGILATYSVGDLNVRMSYVTPNQSIADLPAGQSEEISIADLPAGQSEEISISADYKFGAITVSAAYAMDGNAISDNDLLFLGAEYAFNGVGNVGLLYFSDDNGAASYDLVTLYGNYTFDAITVRAYVGFSEDLGTEDTSFGLGADYDLGGARLSGSIQQGYTGDMRADVGVRFDF